MGREVRRVPPHWQHPKTNVYGSERYQPMHDEPFAQAMHEWYAGWVAWERGEKLPESYEPGDTYWDYHGGPPDPECYRPNWSDEERTHLMMYETTSEGTPISPAFATPEELARWLTDNNASAFGKETASYEAWLRIARGGYACSAVMHDGVLESGVEALKDAPIPAARESSP